MRGLLELYLVAVAISLDTFAASLALGTRVPRRGWLRVAVVFGLCGGLFPLVGVGVGALASGVLAHVAGGVGALVLAGLGGWFLHGAVTGKGAGPDAEPRGGHSGSAPGPAVTPAPGPAAGDPLPLGGLLVLAVGLSSDNLLVGLGIGLQGGTPYLLGAFTAFSVFCATLTGLWLGRKKRLRFGRLAEASAGLLLLALAVVLLVDWLR